MWLYVWICLVNIDSLGFHVQVSGVWIGGSEAVNRRAKLKLSFDHIYCITCSLFAMGSLDTYAYMYVYALCYLYFIFRLYRIDAHEFPCMCLCIEYACNCRQCVQIFQQHMCIYIYIYMHRYKHILFRNTYSVFEFSFVMNLHVPHGGQKHRCCYSFLCFDLFCYTQLFGITIALADESTMIGEHQPYVI